MVADVIPQASPSASPAGSVPVPPPSQDAPLVDPNRSISTIPADSSVPIASSSADIRPASERVMSDSPVDSSEPSQSADETPQVEPHETDVRMQTQSNPVQAEPPADSQSSPISPQSPQSPQVPVAPDLSVSPVSEPVVHGDIKDSSGLQDTSQVQSSPSEPAPETSITSSSETQPESAEINPEAPQGSAMAPSADSKSETVPKQSFGDLMSGTQPPPTSPQPVEIPTLSTPPTPSRPPSETPSLPDLSLPSNPPVPPQPTAPTPSESTVAVDTSASDLTEKRKQAIQVRKQKVADHLEKIVAFAGQRGKVNNHDIRELLHVSQTTVSAYFRALVTSGKLKREGKAKATVYSLP